RLLEIVSKRTGYPPEMIGLDMHLEADLGIDSIKRVEILGVLAESLDDPALIVEMEKLTSIKTLRGLLERLAALGNGNGHAGNGPRGERGKGGQRQPFCPRRHPGAAGPPRGCPRRLRLGDAVSYRRHAAHHRRRPRRR